MSWASPTGRCRFAWCAFTLSVAAATGAEHNPARLRDCDPTDARRCLLHSSSSFLCITSVQTGFDWLQTVQLLVRLRTWRAQFFSKKAGACIRVAKLDQLTTAKYAGFEAFNFVPSSFCSHWGIIYVILSRFTLRLGCLYLRYLRWKFSSSEAQFSRSAMDIWLEKRVVLALSAQLGESQQRTPSHILVSTRHTIR